MLVAFPAPTKKRNNRTRARAHTDHNVATPFQQIQPNDTAGMRRDGAKAGRRLAESKHKGGMEAHPHPPERNLLVKDRLNTSTQLKDPNQSGPSVTFAASMVLLLGSIVVLAWLAVAKSNSCIHNLFLIIPPHGPAAFPPVLNWNNLPACGRQQRIVSLLPNSLFTATFAYRFTQNECMICSSRQLNHPNPGQGSHQEGSFLTW